MSSKNLLLKGLLLWYVIFSLVMAISPADRQFWVLASVLPALLVTGLVVTHQAFPLSTMTYILITLYLTLHTIGVHYTYSKVPMGTWLGQILDLNRNHFDRLVHFSFGFLLTYPLEELFRRLSDIRGWLLYYLPAMTIVGLSGIWEILESWVARIARPDLGLAVLGSQGDIWDAQKDMTAALYGSLLSIALIIIVRKLMQPQAFATEDTAAGSLLEEESAEPS